MRIISPRKELSAAAVATIVSGAGEVERARLQPIPGARRAGGGSSPVTSETVELRTARERRAHRPARGRRQPAGWSCRAGSRATGR